MLVSAPVKAALLILPNFVLILVGLVLARRYDYGRDFWSGLEKLVYYVLFPALLFRSIGTARIDFLQAGAPRALRLGERALPRGASVLPDRHTRHGR